MDGEEVSNTGSNNEEKPPRAPNEALSGEQEGQLPRSTSERPKQASSPTSRQATGDYVARDGVSAEIFPRDVHCVSRKNIDQDALKVLRRLNRYGYKAFLVGGGVRDLLLDSKPKDFDIATNATPKQLKSLFRNCRIIGRRFKLAHVYFKNRKIIEVATFRAEDFSDPSDVDSENQRQSINENIFGDELSDAFRRDLTINALFYDLSNFSIVDYVGGMSDLENRLIRVIGDPSLRFQEDPVRIIRAVRHKVRAEFGYDPETAEAIKNNRNLLSSASAVRLYEELKKDFSGVYVGEYLEDIQSLGLLPDLLGEMEQIESVLSDPESSFRVALRECQTLAAHLGVPTLGFTLLTLQVLQGERSICEAFEQVPTEHERESAIRGIFSRVQAPRKEQEKIASILGTLLHFFNDSLPERRKNTLRHTRHPQLLHYALLGLSKACPNLEVSEEDLSVVQKRIENQGKRTKRGGRRRQRSPKNKKRFM